VELIPSHCDTTINLHDVYYVTRDGYVVAVWPIAGRGRVR
jgi:D-serine deaminase-like pyridoxal phosphate-dependent protein